MNVIPKGSDKLVIYLSEILEQQDVVSPDLIDDPKVLAFMQEILPIEQAANREYRRLLMQIASHKLNVLQLDREWKATERLSAGDLMTAREKTIKQINNQDVKRGLKLAKFDEIAEQLQIPIPGLEDIKPEDYSSPCERSFLITARAAGMELVHDLKVNHKESYFKLDYTVCENGKTTKFFISIMSFAYHKDQLREDYIRLGELQAKGYIPVLVDSRSVFGAPKETIKRVKRIYKRWKKAV